MEFDWHDAKHEKNKALAEAFKNNHKIGKM
jgi:hypothetical protein